MIAHIERNTRFTKCGRVYFRGAAFVLHTVRSSDVDERLELLHVSARDLSDLWAHETGLCVSCWKSYKKEAAK